MNNYAIFGFNDGLLYDIREANDAKAAAHAFYADNGETWGEVTPDHKPSEPALRVYSVTPEQACQLFAWEDAGSQMHEFPCKLTGAVDIRADGEIA